MSNIDKLAIADDESVKTHYIHPAAFGSTKNQGYGHVAVVRAEDFEKLRAKLEAAENLAKQQGNIAVELFDEVTKLRRNADDKAPELRSQLEEAEKRIAELEAPAPELKLAHLINKFYERYPLAEFKSDTERSAALGYFMTGAELQCFGEFINYAELMGDE